MDIENIPELVDYLRVSGRIEPCELPQCRLLTGGVSSRTVLVARPNGEKWVLKQALEKLRVEDDWFSPPDRILREAAGMDALRRITPAGSIPRLLFTDREKYLLALEYVPEPHENWKTILLSGRVEPIHYEQFANLLVSIHRGGMAREFQETFEDRSFFESLRIEPYYLASAARVPPARAFLEALVEETRARRLTLVRSGRLGVSREVRDLVRKMAVANPLWGAPRIHGELLKLGIDISERTVSRLMPKPRKPPSQTWRGFLDNHLAELVSIDFLAL